MVFAKDGEARDERAGIYATLRAHVEGRTGGGRDRWAWVRAGYSDAI